jgi:tripartite-type tricarboxylate transporter receptor subunit TctC
VKKLEEAFRKGMETPEFITSADNFHLRAEHVLSGQPLKDHIEKHYATLGEIIRTAKLGVSK